MTVLLVSGCASSAFDGPVPDIGKNELLSGTAILGHEIDTSTVSDPGLFEVDFTRARDLAMFPDARTIYSDRISLLSNEH